MMRKLVLPLLLISAGGVMLLAVIVKLWPVFYPDIAISLKLQAKGETVLPVVMNLISLPGHPTMIIVGTVTVAMIFFLLSYRREAGFMLLTFLGEGVNFLLKVVVNRPRPDGSLVKVQQQFTDSSFPSGHVVHYVVFFGFFLVTMFTMKRLPLPVRIMGGLTSLALIFLISISRVYLGAHWATDVIGGYLVGAGVLTALVYAYLR